MGGEAAAAGQIEIVGKDECYGKLAVLGLPKLPAF